MCGIAGATGEGARSLVERMRDALAHRGPDGRGIFFDERLALGHRRLSIIDLSEAASQPFASDDGSLQLVFNGEVYDYLELRSELEGKGRKFKSASDTEVILRGYEEWGERVFEHLNGMFAIALYDKTKKKLLLARDRAGEKPLHFGFLGGRFLSRASSGRSRRRGGSLLRRSGSRATFVMTTCRRPTRRFWASRAFRAARPSSSTSRP